MNEWRYFYETDSNYWSLANCADETDDVDKVIGLKVKVVVVVVAMSLI